MKKSSATLRGIVVAGDSRQEVENHYRAVATGLSVQALQDTEENFVILSNADSELSLMNPFTGDMNLVEASDLSTDDFEFYASGGDNDETVNVFYTLCSDGCGSHIIADDADLMNRCPVCASELQDLDADDIAGIEEEMNAEANADDDDESFDSESSESEPSMLVVASSQEEAVEAFRALASGETEPLAFDCETGIVVTASGSDFDFEFSPFTGEAATDAGEIDEFSVEASSEDQYDAHYYVCASDDCGCHIVTSSEDSVFCPVCASGLLEPEALASEEDDEDDDSDESDESALSASSDDDDEEDLDDEDDDDELDDESLFEDDEEEDDIEATASDDDEDDEDDEEEDDDEDDEDDEEEDDDEEFDDKNTLSVASVTIEEDDNDADDSATASAEQLPLESVSTDLLAMASAAAGELVPAHLDVAFAGNLAGTPTWLATYSGKIVATATPETASGIESNVFHSDTFGNLVHASAKENGVREALTELGFRPIEASVDVDSYIQEEVSSRVEAGVSSVRSNFEQSSSDYAARFEAALATAATGVNKNFFEDVKNPIKAALASSISSLGIRNADRLVAQAFTQHNDTYLKGLVAKACEIMEYDVSIQNQLTKAVASAANEQSVATASDSGADSLSIGRPVEGQQRNYEQTATSTVQPQQEATASASTKPKANMELALSSLGRRGRT